MIPHTKTQFTNRSSQIEEYPKFVRLLPEVKVVHTPKSLKRTQDLPHFKITRA
jgi:hypothetical protein